MYQKIWDLLYPKCCPICFEILDNQEALICPKCRKKPKLVKQPYCYRCGKPLAKKEQEYCEDCKRVPKSYDRGVSILEYDEVCAPSILAIKYKNQRQFLSFYSFLAKQQYEGYLNSLGLECLIPVPISKKKRRKRGFNQAELFAKELSKWLGIPVRSSYLLRKKETTPLKQLNPLQRKEELERAFVWNKKTRKGRQEVEKIVLLVDDIYTSGATANACSMVLKRQGVRKVYVLTMAIGRKE